MAERISTTATFATTAELTSRIDNNTAESFTIVPQFLTPQSVDVVGALYLFGWHIFRCISKAVSVLTTFFSASLPSINDCISMAEWVRTVEQQMTKTVLRSCSNDLLTSFPTTNLLAGSREPLWWLPFWVNSFPVPPHCSGPFKRLLSGLYSRRCRISYALCLISACGFW
jgi:hypothetical protein